MLEPADDQFLFLDINYLRKRTFMYVHGDLAKELFYNGMDAKRHVYICKCTYK